MMSRNKHSGNKKGRCTKRKTRQLYLGNYIIFTDTECTEKNYIDGLAKNMTPEQKEHISIKVFNTKTKKLVKECLNKVSLEPQYAEPWIVFDKDQVIDFDDIIEDAKSHNINVGWSNPCIEVWFEAYFGKMNYYISSKVCCEKFGEHFERITKKPYDKSSKTIYDDLLKYGNLEKAFIVAEKRLQNHKDAEINKASEMNPGTTIHNLVLSILSSINKQ